MTDFFKHCKIIEDELLDDINDAKWKYKNYIMIRHGFFHEVSNWLHGNLQYRDDYEYFIDFDENHYIFFSDTNMLLWFLLSNNLTNYTVHIE